MKKKLTLELDEELVKSALNYAEARGKSLSQVVADYFYMLDQKIMKKSVPLTSVVKTLKGSLKNSGIDEGDYKSFLEDKYL